MLEKILKRYWGFDSFRPLQKEIINSILEGHDTLGILPTGGGKSITFQVPGLAMDGIVIVVTPLISLMKDQVDNLKKKRVKAVYFHSGMSYRERNEKWERILNNNTKFLYISPEKLSGESFIKEIKPLKVSMIVVDEAHCISQWGYDFRPSYLKIKNLRKVFPSAPVLALTASATPEVATDICLQLNFKEGSNLFRSSILRDNLCYVVRPSEEKLNEILHILSSVPGSAIVYVRSRKKTRELAEYLINNGISSSYYHAGLDPLEKDERQTKWKNGEIRVMVATNAFGMGIDKEDVRIVLHYDLPTSLEEYYQEAGRAGRDGNPAYAVLLPSKHDKATLRRRLTMEFPPKEVIKKIYTRLCVFSHLEIGSGYDKTVEFDLVKFCHTYNLEESLVRPAIKILSQAGYVEFIEEFENSSRIKVTVGRDELYEVKITSPSHEKILTAILRNYPGVFTDYVFISEKKLSYLTQLEPDTIYNLLTDLSKQKILHYIPRRRTPILYFPTSMEEEKYIVIGKSTYENRKEIYKRRIESMIDYGYDHKGCRVEKLEKYFGEENIEKCGNCDNCRQNKKNQSSDDTKISEHLRKIFLSNKDRVVGEEEIQRIFGKASIKAIQLLRNLEREGVVLNIDKKWKLKI